MNIALWIAQGLLAAMYLIVGSMKVFQPAKVHENPRMTWGLAIGLNVHLNQRIPAQTGTDETVESFCDI